MRRWLYLEFWWSAHNLLAHPFSQVLWWLGYAYRPARRWSDWVHDWTVPEHTPEEGRG